jgi:hypothetical protein
MTTDTFLTEMNYTVNETLDSLRTGLTYILKTFGYSPILVVYAAIFVVALVNRGLCRNQTNQHGRL